MVARNRQIKATNAVVAPSIADLMASLERMNQASVQFLKIDLETAFTFVRIAQDTKDTARRARNIQSARKAYETVLKFSRKLDLHPDDTLTINQALEGLKTKLTRLGEVF